MPHSIETKARKYLLEKVPKALPSNKKTFDFIIDGKYIELKGKGNSIRKIDFISLTDKQQSAIGKIVFDIYLICGLNTSKPEMYKIDPKKLKEIKVRKVTSYEYDRSEIRKIMKRIR